MGESSRVGIEGLETLLALLNPWVYAWQPGDVIKEIWPSWLVPKRFQLEVGVCKKSVPTSFISYQVTGSQVAAPARSTGAQGT